MKCPHLRSLTPEELERYDFDFLYSHELERFLHVIGYCDIGDCFKYERKKGQVQQWQEGNKRKGAFITEGLCKHCYLILEPKKEAEKLLDTYFKGKEKCQKMKIQ